MSTLLKQIRKIRIKEQYLENLIENFENLITFCFEEVWNNVDEIFLEESGGGICF